MTTFDALFFGAPSEEFLEYRDESMKRFNHYTQNSEHIDTLTTNTAHMYQKYSSDEAIDAVKDVYASMGGQMNLDVITYLDDPSKASHVMRKYIMSDPIIRRRYRKNYIHGYRSIENTREIDKGNDSEDTWNHDYLMVTSGWDGEGEYISDTEPLNLSEQIAIQDTLTNLHNLLADGIDGTEVE